MLAPSLTTISVPVFPVFEKFFLACDAAHARCHSLKSVDGFLSEFGLKLFFRKMFIMRDRD